ncbi:MAJOR FACILITATOR SUPERFAMILY MEMBER protein, putative [Babesia bigemina]|uniref:MAJOR FACILITATOR SUPERFAMILY MEMBER protein, putative n=1 Tax=Babesia bigemina TaxID=5866 RepID=A0A061D1M3_BABBI|nr:MAJOR FACILITATOR SUPERFAMILY MEMBER protein, putative [Babesia bigemina]CDR94548.1 MAJOR FACILITATOR SUPERFAMILY MEMBER protein, putative [Babesia bigemina]|eukprot:XP_012766734.1 MAJOR FACILITATOR SUPERFAMILY MEMBER protein, putative [Babesia bigemina]
MAEGSSGSDNTSAQLDRKLEYGPLAKALYILVSFFEGYDQQVLSMCMRTFELTLGFSQSQLSTLATVSTMSRMGCCLLWGLLADQHDSNLILGAGLLVMGMASIFLSSASHYKVIVFLRFLHGFGFACVYPVQQKIVSDSTESKEAEDKRKSVTEKGTKGGAGSPGTSVTPTSPEADTAKTSKKKESKEASTMFTALQALNCIGRLLCAVITTIIARKVLLGYYGWRTSYVVLGYVWILFGIGILFGLTPLCRNEAYKSDENFKELLEDAFSNAFRRATTWILILTIFIAEAPMSAFNYMTIYLQYLGVSDTMAGVAIAVTLIGGAAGSGAGGKIIEKIADLEDGFGELGCGIAVMVVRLVVCLLFFLGKPPCGKLLWYHYVELATLGGTLVTVGGVDRALLKSSVENKSQATASATVRTISGISSSIILFQVCAYLTEKVFGYVPSRESFETMATDIKERNAEALRKSMMYIILAGTLLNVVCYVVLFFTYKMDKKKVDENNANHKKKVEEKPKQLQEGSQKCMKN